jgi:hypothetical protein
MNEENVKQGHNYWVLPGCAYRTYAYPPTRKRKTLNGSPLLHG